MQVSEQGFVRFQLGSGSWFLDQGPQVHFLQAPVYLLCHLPVWEDWVLEIHYHLQTFEDKPWVPVLPNLQVLWKLVPRWEPPWRFLLCTFEGATAVPQWLAGQAVVPVFLSLCKFFLCAICLLKEILLILDFSYWHPIHTEFSVQRMLWSLLVLHYYLSFRYLVSGTLK